MTDHINEWLTLPVRLQSHQLKQQADFAQKFGIAPEDHMLVEVSLISKLQVLTALRACRSNHLQGACGVWCLQGCVVFARGVCKGCVVFATGVCKGCVVFCNGVFARGMVPMACDKGWKAIGYMLQ
jgi:hypothetical protein